MIPSVPALVSREFVGGSLDGLTKLIWHTAKSYENGKLSELYVLCADGRLWIDTVVTALHKQRFGE
jgi:hypothetical protein